MGTNGHLALLGQGSSTKNFCQASRILIVKAVGRFLEICEKRKIHDENFFSDNVG